jgi:hypothetical protein
MYTGKLISELMATVERAELRVATNGEQERIDEELHAIFSMQIPITQDGQVYMGAA